MALDRVGAAHADFGDRLAGDPKLAGAVVAVTAASRSLTRLLETDAAAIDVLAEPSHRREPDVASPEALVAWKRRELLRIAALDLIGAEPFEVTVAALSVLASDVLDGAVTLAGVGAEGLAVIGMGKLGGHELNYASDVDVMIVGSNSGEASQRAARQVVDIARRCFRVDVGLRPEGRDGPLVRTVDGFVAHWERWAAPWEFQALLKARQVAGAVELGDHFAAAAAEHLWGRSCTADDLRSLRALKARSEAAASGRPSRHREVKRGPGGIRDIEFSVQLLQLVHGPADPELRLRGTLPALRALATGGYVAEDDASWLSSSYRFLRRVEHAVQLVEEQQVHAVPADEAARRRLARIVGFRDTPRRRAVEDLDTELAACRATVRAIHERLYFRPLLEAFSSSAGRAEVLRPEATAARLAAFGFSDAERTRQAVSELTRGVGRSSRLMAQLLPLLLDWLSGSPDPDAGLLGLRELASGPTRSTALAAAFRDSPETARRLCVVLGTSRRLGALLARNPDLIASLGVAPSWAGAVRPAAKLAATARAAVDLRATRSERRRALARFTGREGLRVAVDDVLDLIPADGVGPALADVAEAAVSAALVEARPRLPFAVIALGRFGGGELGYGSDLDLVFVYDGTTATDHSEGERAAIAVHRFLGGEGGERIYDVDLDLRPEGRQGPIARSLDGYDAYFTRWARPWERQAMVRARAVGGDPEVGRRFLATLAPHLWRGLTAEDHRELRRIKARVEAERIPAGEDPAFHLKLGPGALADVEFCTQLLQLTHALPETRTLAALDQLATAGHLSGEEATVLSNAHRFCERTRNRWFLVRGSRVESLPTGEDLTRLARSLRTTGPALRDEYRRLTRRARQVVRRVFAGAG